MISKEIAKQVLEACLLTGADFAELFEEKKYSSSINTVNGVVERSNSGTEYGVGLRVYDKLSSVYAYTNDTSLDNLLKMAKQLAGSINNEEKISCKELKDVTYTNINPIKRYPSKAPVEEKLAYMNRAYEAASNYDEIITKVLINYLDEEQEVLIANTEGVYAQDIRVRTRMGISAVAEADGKMQDGSQAPGGSMGLEFYDTFDLEATAREAARIAKEMLYADECPSGTMDVVINNGFGGVIFHEACGHALEASSVSRNQSVFSNKIGQKIASDIVSAVDDGTIPNAWGSANIDDEGHPTQRNVLIENGVLKGYMVDQLNGRRMHTPSSGSGRRESYSYEPTSRMTNTFICNGTSTFDEIIKATEYGLFAANLGGGSVNPATGNFNFAVREGYLIEHGKITKPVKGATLVGNGAETLFKIDMVANNVSRAQGMCGAASGSIPTDVGQPTIRVKAMSVGGRGGAQ